MFFQLAIQRKQKHAKKGQESVIQTAESAHLAAVLMEKHPLKDIIWKDVHRVCLILVLSLFIICYT